jgi:TnpA family transposase
MSIKSQRLHLLSTFEVHAIYNLPVFTDIERANYFRLDDEEMSALKGLHPSARLYFMVQLGYFKAKHLLFDFSWRQVREDVKYLLSHYFPGMKFPKTVPSRNRITSVNQKILLLLGFRGPSPVIQQLLIHKLAQSVSQLNQPLKMLRDLMAYMENEKIVFPRYSALQDLVGAALVAEEKRIAHEVQTRVSQKTIDLLDKLFTVQKEQRFYDLTLLKQNPKNFNFKMMQTEIKKHTKYYALYKVAKRFLPKLSLSEQNISYYGSLVDHYPVQSLQSFSAEKRYFYLLCYVYHRFQKMNNQLIETLSHYVDSYNKESKSYSKTRAAEINTEIKTKHGQTAKTLIDWYFDKTLSKKIYAELQQQAAEMFSCEEASLVGEFLVNDEVDKKRYEWEFHDKNFQCMIKNLRPLIKILDFQALPHQQELLAGIQFIQSIFRKNQTLKECELEDFPLDTLPSHLKQYLLERDLASRKKVKPIKSIHLYRYEFYLYDHLNKQLAANTIYVNDTTQYKHFSDDIKSKKTAKEKKKLLDSLDAPRLNRSAKSALSELKNRFEEVLILTNENIENGKNTHIKIKGQGKDRTWTLPYQKKKDEYNNPFYDQMEVINFFDIMMSVHGETLYLDVFTHYKTHFSKNKKDLQALCACIVANATGLGTHKMADFSDMSYNYLRSIEKNYLYLAALREANDRLNQKFSELPIYPYYHLGNIFHGASDAQKYKTKNDTFNARHSQKFYGLDKGVAPYSFGINYAIVNAIPDKGTHSHESHFLFDLIMSNTSGIEPERVSTDTEGSNQIMFVLMYFANIDFAPCYRSLRKKVEKIGGFQKPEAYPESYLIKPSYKFNEKSIEDEWQNIQDIMSAFLSNETSISVITRKLCSHELKDKTKRAIWELNDILRSIYLLRYVNDPLLRSYIRAALNRIEAFHSLKRKVVETNGTGLRGGSDVEIAIWNECARLVTNIAMYHNASLLSKLMLLKEAKGDMEAVARIRGFSPIASQHMNFGGRYEFKKDPKPIDIDKMLEMLDKIELGDAIKKKPKKK